MKWKGRRQSQHVEDRRGTRIRNGGRSRAGADAIGSIVFALFRRSSGKTRILIIIAAIAACFIFRINPLTMMRLTGGGSQPVTTEQVAVPDDHVDDYLSTMLADNEDTWTKILAEHGVKFRPSKMVIYTKRVETAGGIADANMGPFYSPSEEKIYIDPTFFDEMKQKYGATGDFAEAYVIAHEVGHHIQHILGYTEKVHGQRDKVSDIEYNKLSVRLELQADFLAGVFSHHAQNTYGFLENGDIEEAMRCAEAIGDDRLQNLAQGRIQPDLFTHGTSAQRKKWFMKGYNTGDLKYGDTFSIPYNKL